MSILQNPFSHHVRVFLSYIREILCSSNPSLDDFYKPVHIPGHLFFLIHGLVNFPVFGLKAAVIFHFQLSTCQY